MSITNLTFENEQDYKVARDIKLRMLEREGWKPRPDLEMLVDDKHIAELKRGLDERGVSYKAEPV